MIMSRLQFLQCIRLRLVKENKSFSSVSGNQVCLLPRSNPFQKLPSEIHRPRNTLRQPVKGSLRPISQVRNLEEKVTICIQQCNRTEPKKNHHFDQLKVDRTAGILSEMSLPQQVLNPVPNTERSRTAIR